MLQANSRDLGQHTAGQWRTDWHYRTSHPLEEILSAGNNYWLGCIHLLRAGDIIIVEDVALNWQYLLTVRNADEKSMSVIVKMLHGQEMMNGVTVFDAEAMNEEVEKLKRIQEEEAKLALRKQEFEAQFDTEEAKPQIIYKGKKNKYTIFGYDMIIKDGFETKEAAMTALESGEFSENIKVARDAHIHRVSRNG